MSVKNMIFIADISKSVTLLRFQVTLTKIYICKKLPVTTAQGTGGEQEERRILIFSWTELFANKKN